MTRARCVALCAGIGGLEAALPADVVMASDIDQHAAAHIRRTLPAADYVPDWTELADLDGWAPDLLTGGLPCQPYSSLGRQRGAADARSLFAAFAALLGRTRRRPAIMLENVEAFAATREYRQLVGDLARLGYRSASGVVSAASVGAAHRRRRWFLLAAHADGPPLVPATMPRRYRDLPDQTLPTPMASRGKGGVDTLSVDETLLGPQPAHAHVASAGRSGRARALLTTPTGPGTGRAAPSIDVQVGIAVSHREPLLRQSPLVGADGLVADWRQYGPAIERWGDVLGAPPPQQVRAATLKRCSPEFVGWLMGFTGAALPRPPRESQALRLLGNAVVPLQAAAAYCDLSDDLAAQLPL